MAITKIGPPLSGIRGTIGGITYSANKSGPYAKLWAPPVNPRSPNQSIERSYISQMPELWRDMTDVQRAAWDTFAALGAQELENSLGEAYYASGYNWFSKCNVRLLRAGRATIVPVPTQARPAAPTIDDFRVCVAGTESDLCICGVASASTETVGQEADKAFDDIVATYWRTLAPATTGWLKYIFCAPENIKHYRINRWQWSATAILKDWTFEVWDGGAWQTLHTVTDAVFPQDTWIDFYCENPYTKTNYRLNISANNGHANGLVVPEMEMYAGDEGSSVVCYPEDDFEDAPSYDLVLHLSMGRSIGMAVQYPGYYETLAIQDPGRWHALFQDQLEPIFGTVLDGRSWFAQLARQTTQGIRSAWQTERTVTIGA